MKKFSLYDVLGVSKKVYKPEAQYKHPLMYAFKNICDKTGYIELYKSGKIASHEADLIIAKFKAYKNSLPSKNRRTTQAQLDVLERLTKFANKYRFS